MAHSVAAMAALPAHADPTGAPACRVCGAHRAVGVDQCAACGASESECRRWRRRSDVRWEALRRQLRDRLMVFGASPWMAWVLIAVVFTLSATT